MDWQWAPGLVRPDHPWMSLCGCVRLPSLAKAGIPTMGPRLWGVLREAGLRPVGLIGIQSQCGPDDPAAVALAYGVLRAVAPLIERAGGGHR